MPNRLASESSPYLRQHAENPVDWYPWGDEALAKARSENRPILLSIGYSACHWCHVMAHESFEDPATAAVMNELFVNIKVDREERPDLDKVYQLAHQMLVQRPGGWPLTMFLTPDEHIPFFGGTYFPDAPRHGMPSFQDVLRRVAGFFEDDADAVEQQSVAVRDVFDRISRPVNQAEEPGRAALDLARSQLEENFDKRWGGFGSAPKFPHPTSIERLLRHWRSTATGDQPDLQALYMVTLSLQRMAQGGIFDQLGGGFCRYSVDGYWMIPHFEKMLYDNGPLLALYSRLWAVTNEPLFQQVANQTADWALREMQSPEGGYYSTLDADSEGGEGMFYVWTRDEIRELVTDAEFGVVSKLYGVDRDPNFEGQWHLFQARSVEDVAGDLDLEPAVVEELAASAREKLLEARETRSRPGRDEKVLTAWNGLMIGGMAVAARHLGRSDLAESAFRAAEFIRERLWVDDRLMASFKDGQARYSGYLDDYAFLLAGILELLQIEWRTPLIEFARELADVMLNNYRDHDNGGFYFTSEEQENLIHRPKPLADEATPSGNGIAALSLNRLGCILGESRYLDAAAATIRSAGSAVSELPYAHCSLLDALEETLDPVEIVIIRGRPDAISSWHQAAMLMYAPRRLCFAIPDDVTDLPDGLEAKEPRDDVVAYLCRGTVCGPPLTSLSELTNTLRESA